MTFQTYTGVCKGGPWDRKVRTAQSRRIGVSADGKSFGEGAAVADGGSYYYRPASGPTPGQWLWVEKKDGSE